LEKIDQAIVVMCSLIITLLGMKVCSKASLSEKRDHYLQ